MLVTAIARIRFDFTYRVAAGMVSNATWWRPASRSGMDWPVPLYGTCRMFVLVMVLNSSPARCGVLPLPAEGKLITPGCDLDSAISCFTEAAGSAGCTVTMCG